MGSRRFGRPGLGSLSLRGLLQDPCGIYRPVGVYHGLFVFLEFRVMRLMASLAGPDSPAGSGKSPGLSGKLRPLLFPMISPDCRAPARQDRVR